MNQNVTIFWDIENVTPPSSNTLFIEGMWDFAESMGRVVSSYAYADWSKPGFRRLAPSLAEHHFYMVHVPRERKTKNSADMQLVTDALDLLRFHGHIDTFVLITGDSDFRPLLTALRKAGKMVHIICDIKTAAQDLLAIADSFTDFREVLPGGDDDNDEENDTPAPRPSKKNRNYWYELLAEASAILLKERKSTNISSVKIKLKMLNKQFSEKALGFKRWSDFVTAAVQAGYVSLDEKNDQTFVHPGKQSSAEGGSLQTALRALISILSDFDKKEKREKPDFHAFSLVSSELKRQKIDLRGLGFNNFKSFAQSAEARGLIETKVENTFHSMKRIIS